ncbi:MAG: class I SAM-dependent methyltransferase [Bellilinea sp.]
MLTHARRKISEVRLRNVEIYEGDAEHLDFADGAFDHVNCSLGLFFMRDMVAALREWQRVLKPGGSIGFSSFGVGLFEPLKRYHHWAGRGANEATDAETTQSDRKRAHGRIEHPHDA